MAKLAVDRTAITAADMLNDKVIPWFNEQEVPLLHILTDRGNIVGRLKTMLIKFI